MASPVLRQSNDSQLGVVAVRCKFTSGASGAVPAGTKASLVKSVVRNSAGNYTYTMNETWLGVENVVGNNMTGASYDATKAANAVLVSSTITTDGKFTVQFIRPDTGAATDPSSGDVVSLRADLKYLKSPN